MYSLSLMSTSTVGFPRCRQGFLGSLSLAPSLSPWGS